MALPRVLPLTALSLLLALPGQAQTPQAPTLRAGQGQLAIEALHIQVQVAGTLATTTWDLTFRNPQGRVLEGELVFPLGEGQTVSRFALPVNGTLREGVVVEKAKGRQAFEEVVRRPTVVDPGLLEKTEGQAFRTRIYPIPANGTYRVVLAYEQELRDAGGLRYQLPLAFAEPIADFRLRVDLQEQTGAPFQVGGPQGLTFQSQGRTWWAEHRSRQARLDRSLDLRLPPTPSATFLHREGAQAFFHVHLDLPAPRRPKPLPRRLLVVWDASASAAQRDLARERALLASYLERLKEATVEVAVLRNAMDPIQTFAVKGGRAPELLAFLQAQPLDGGTRLDALRLARRTADEVLLFGDGLSNLGAGEPQFPRAPLTTLSSAPNSHHARLRALAEAQGGEYLNLQGLSDEEAREALLSRPLAFLGYGGAPGVIHEVYPARGAVVRGPFGLAGRLVGDRATFTLRFGYGQEVACTREVVVDVAQATATPLASRIWAQKKLAFLEQDREGHHQEILELGRTFGIVTDETSLIVLERVEDYVRHRIPPPEELRGAYEAQVRQQDQGKMADREAQILSLAQRLEELKDWWKQDYQPAPPQHQPPGSSPRPGFLRRLFGGTGTLQGRVLDRRGGPLAGARVVGQGPNTEQVQVTDASGEYVLEGLPPGAYRVTASCDGYLAAQGMASFDRGTALRLDFALATAESAAATVEVVANVAVPDTPRPRSAAQPLQSLPRSVSGATSLAPGVTGTPAIRGGSAQSTVVEVVASSAAMDRTRTETAFSLDGVDTRSAPSPESPTQGTIRLAAWRPDTPYLKALREVPPGERYEAYLNLRKAYANPGFYLDVAAFFEKAKARDLALRVLSNLAELDLDAPALLRVLGHRLLQLGEADLALRIFERVLRLREEEPQSHRDLALALAEAGQFQRAAERLYQVATTRWENRFDGVDLIALNELNALAATQRVSRKGFDPRLRADLPVDVRVVLTWDTNDSDMDLHVTDPSGETCSFNHTRTAQRGRTSQDLTQGYGPEEFLLRRARPGTYRIQANYFGTRQQTAVIGPTTLKAELFLHYGTPRQTRKEILLRLDGQGGMLEVGTFEIQPR